MPTFSSLMLDATFLQHRCCTRAHSGSATISVLSTLGANHAAATSWWGDAPFLLPPTPPAACPQQLVPLLRVATPSPSTRSPSSVDHAFRYHRRDFITRTMDLYDILSSLDLDIDLAVALPPFHRHGCRCRSDTRPLRQDFITRTIDLYDILPSLDPNIDLAVALPPFHRHGCRCRSDTRPLRHTPSISRSTHQYHIQEKRLHHDAPQSPGRRCQSAASTIYRSSHIIS
jgi:hypothetical protein